MNVDVRLTHEGVVAIVFKLALQNDVHAVLAGIRPDRERSLQAVVGAHGILVLFKHEELADRVDHVGALVERDG